MTEIKLTAQKVPFSSIVGQVVTLHDPSGAVVCQLGIHGVRMDLDYRETAEAVADALCDAFNYDDGSAYLPGPAKARSSRNDT